MYDIYCYVWHILYVKYIYILYILPLYTCGSIQRFLLKQTGAQCCHQHLKIIDFSIRIWWYQCFPTGTVILFSFNSWMCSPQSMCLWLSVNRGSLYTRISICHSCLSCSAMQSTFIDATSSTPCNDPGESVLCKHWARSQLYLHLLYTTVHFTRMNVVHLCWKT